MQRRLGKHQPRRLFQIDIRLVKFWRACLSGNFNDVQSYINQGIDVNTEVDGFETKIDNNGYTGLHLVCSISDNKKENRLAIVNTIMSHTTIVDPVDRLFKHTPLHWACNKGLFDIVKLLVKNGADITWADNQGRTPLEFARAQDFETIAAFIEGVGVGQSLNIL